MGQFVLILLLVLIFSAVVLAVEATARLLFSFGDQNKRVNRRLTMLASGMQHAEVYSALVRRPALPFDSDPALVRLYERFALFCRQAGLQMSPLRLLGFLLAIALGMWVATLFTVRAGDFLGVALNSTLTFIASAVITGLGAWVWLGRQRSKRLRALEDQLPSALDIINRALRAGHPVVSAVQLASDEMGDPIGSEFGLIVDETTYGFEFKEALANFARRTGSPDAKFFAVSVGVQSETGGNLAEVLEGLAAVMRGRATLSKRVKALSSEGRISALILTALPVFLVAFMMLIAPTFYTSKFADPIFWPSVGGILVLYLIGWLIIHRIINFRF
jgi:tight adherence protein B